MTAVTGSGPAAGPAVGGAARALAWLRRRDPSLAAVRRAGRVTVASCVAFYTCRYLIDDPITALYALFAAVALGGLSEARDGRRSGPGSTPAASWSPVCWSPSAPCWR